MAELRDYPSGFLGSASVKNTRPMEKAANQARILDGSSINPIEGRPAALEVCQIWEAYSSGADEAKTFEFTERVISCAVKVFGTTYLIDWIAAQPASPDWDEWNFRWIEETLNYVYRGKPRALSYNNWVSLLAIDGDDGPTQNSEAFKRLGDGSHHHATIADFIQSWLQNDGGFTDLVESLYVLFGNR